MRASKALLSVAMASKPKMNVHDFPRPPLLEQIPRHLVIKWKYADTGFWHVGPRIGLTIDSNEIVADTKEGYWALETTVAIAVLPMTPPLTFRLNSIPRVSSDKTPAHDDRRKPAICLFF